MLQWPGEAWSLVTGLKVNQKPEKNERHYQTADDTLKFFIEFAFDLLPDALLPFSIRPQLPTIVHFHAIPSRLSAPIRPLCHGKPAAGLQPVANSATGLIFTTAFLAGFHGDIVGYAPG